MTSHNVDLAIIGSGSGNSLITNYWDDKKVAIAEGSTFGGTCLNVGCIPTKMFVRPAHLARGVEEAARLGVKMSVNNVDWPAMRDRIFGRIDAISSGGEDYRERLENVELISQYVTLGQDNTLTAQDGTTVTAKQVVIASGSRPSMPDIEGIDLDAVHTSDSVMRLDKLPESLVIVGGGYIACEFAAMFSGLGTKVTQLVRSGALMRQLDTEISEAYNKEAAAHWTVRYHTEAQAIRQTDSGLDVVLGDETLRTDAVLVAIGRIPNTDKIGAKQAGLDLHQDGRLKVDEYQRVLRAGEPVTGLYALGDISSASQLKHVANYEARLVAYNLEHPGSLRKNSNRAVPAAVFTHPEIAIIGLTEDEAREQLGAENLTVKTQKFGDTAYGWAMEEQTGLFKVLADKRTGKLVGAHAMGPESSNLIQPVIMAMNLDIDAHTAATGQYWIHPALMEVVENALLGLDVPDSGLL
ncbi:mycothione reductase [Arthrobacter sp. MYb213]|uniref:mycothione reductase n=1 Tax=Arthrobacter sp. MYb213 TaxID=1848595 RepID=UPI000CFBCB00|nr:mycothione reductase [Arthrobacter sp. MYb213]PRB67993.1 mycothione reductase [Arthrobacter sp. MYb213]